MVRRKWRFESTAKRMALSRTDFKLREELGLAAEREAKAGAVLGLAVIGVSGPTMFRSLGVEEDNLDVGRDIGARGVFIWKSF